MSDYRAIPLREVLADFTPEQRALVEARARELIAEELTLRQLRKARRLTQAELAERLGGRQVYISRLERRSDMKLSTLRSYVKALGGEVDVMVTFPDGPAVRLQDIETAAGGARGG